MIRLVLGDDGSLGVDLAGRAFGRGAWVHARVDCLTRASDGGASKSFKARVETSSEELLRAVRAAADRRVEALVSSARGAGRLAAGSDAAREAFESGRASLVLVALDGRASSREGFVTAAASAGKAALWGTKERIGRAAGRSDTALAAVLDAGLADAITRAVALASLSRPAPERGRSEAPLTEVR